MARPMPFVPPVTSALKPFNPRSMSLLSVFHPAGSLEFLLRPPLSDLSQIHAITGMRQPYSGARYFLLMPAPTVYFGSTKLPSRTRPHWLSIMYASQRS